MCVSGGRLHLRVTEQFPDHRETLTECQGSGSIAVTQVMNTHVLQSGARADAAPGLLQIGEVGPRQLADDDPGIAVLAGEVRQNGAGLGPERHDPPSSLRVRQLDAVVFDMLPAEELDLRQAAARQQQQAEGGDRGRHLGFGLAEDLAQPLGFLG